MKLKSNFHTKNINTTVIFGTQKK